MMHLLLVKGKKEINPVLVKLGFALVLSLTGFLVSHFRSHRRSKFSSEDDEPEGSGKGLKDELRILKNEEPLSKIINGTSTTTTTTTTTTTFVNLSPSSKSSSNEDQFLLPEFNELFIKDYEVVDTTPVNIKEESEMEQEIASLKYTVLSLRERERNLELQLLEYYGLEEQEAAMRELESQVRINSMESKLFSLKIESLQTENQRLQAQILDCSRNASELESTKAKVKSLKRKMKEDADDANKKIDALQWKVSKLQNKVEMDERDRTEYERKLEKFKELEEEAMNLRLLNAQLAEENLELNKKLETSLVDESKSENLEQIKHLEEENSRLTKEIEQLQTDRCTDVEELVYLRWVNACLRYELRNYQPLDGKTVARDLSKTISPKSEEKAKQLILEYANSRDEQKRLDLVDFDIDYYCSSSQTSDEISNDAYDMTKNNGRKSKSKFFAKLKKLVLGKESNGTRSNSANFGTPTSSYTDSDRRVSFSTYSVDDMIGRESCTSLSPCIDDLSIDDMRRQKKHAQSQSRPSLDIQRMRKMNLEEAEEKERSCSFRRMTSLDESSMCGSSVYSEETESPEKVELKKFADVLKKSRVVYKLKR